MYFKVAGKKIQVLAYRGYNREKKRADVRMIGSISGQIFTPTERHKDSITESEYKEIEAYIEAVQQKDREQSNVRSLRHLAKTLLEANEGLEVMELTTGQAREIWAGIEAIGKTLRRKNFKQRELLRGSGGRSE